VSAIFIAINLLNSNLNMKKCHFVRRVPYRLPNKNRLVWSIVLAQREGMSLLFVAKPDANWTHSLVVATENIQEHVFESVQSYSFPLEISDLAAVGEILQALGEDFEETDFESFFRPNCSFGDN
jgi:hypothetical protein